MQVNREEFYSEAFPTVCRRLGYISSQARAVLLGRHALRCLGWLSLDFSPNLPEQHLELLPILRTLLESQLSLDGSQRKFSAPYFPSGRPETFILARKRGREIVVLDCNSASSKTKFPHSKGHHTSVSSSREELLFVAEFALFLEIKEATRSTNLSSKGHVDKRCKLLTQTQLWANLNPDNSRLEEAAKHLFRKAMSDSPIAWKFWWTCHGLMPLL